MPQRAEKSKCQSFSTDAHIPADPYVPADPPKSIRIGISKKPVKRESKNAHYGIMHRTVAIDELTELIKSGHALGAICGVKHCYENFMGRQDIQLDIDSDQVNPLAYYSERPFVKKFGFLVYTTRKPGHCRIMFRLSKQITNPVQFKRYADALVQMFGADKAATSPAQLWYTYAGCDVASIGKTLPLAELDRVANRYSDPTEYEPPTALADPETLLQQAVDSLEGRNIGGYNLALSLRCLNMPLESANVYLKRYQAIVGTRGSHYYSIDEALDSLNSAYRHRKHNDLAITERMKEAILSSELPINVRKTAFAFLEAMNQVGRTVNVNLSVRQIARAATDHIDKQTVNRHLPILKEAGLFRSYPGDKGKSTVYTLLPWGGFRDIETQQTGNEGAETALSNPIPVCCVSISRIVFGELQHSAATEPNAKIHPMLATDEHDALVRLGGGIQIVVAVLASIEGQTVVGMEKLQEMCNLSPRLTSRAVSSLLKVGLVTVAYVKVDDGYPKAVTLSPAWRGKLRDVEPLLTTYGRNILRAEKSQNQRIAYHQHIADNAKSDDTRAKHDQLVERAIADLKVVDIQHIDAMEERRAAAQRVGLQKENAPPLSLTTGKRKRKTQQPLVADAKGLPMERRLIPDADETETTCTVDSEGVATFNRRGVVTSNNRILNREWLAQHGYLEVTETVDRISLVDETVERITVKKYMPKPVVLMPKARPAAIPGRVWL